ncbi:C4-dicarboxylate TRAP transporter substrate-binding protein [Ruixingdingia sedimenti]|uniref:C4-dicarboxylate TRAP transporter substrate-binding protein n=1 Tax=Ruixingdingia sedimenti TaxID=3073604 RepID=A0ABU1F3Q8_9RHOB|nr:C4-dicarboxylate TRAP transporter substrate-binding protein [Xinfangfangia sp. LG-4]MDR5651501.1 C4-dicarboxylate TRAP transporter substrate-binding protein [Xinfangfangia sp. LG-4]
MPIATIRNAALSGLAALALTTAAEARDLRFAHGFPPGSIGDQSHHVFADKAKELSNGDLNVQIFPRSLLSFTEMLGGLRDGIADIGFLLFPYSPAEFPNSNMVADMTMMWNLSDTDNRAALAWTGALSEYVMLNCPECLDELKAQNAVYTGSQASQYVMLCANKKVVTAEDLKGLNLRAPGSHWARWAQAVGARTVSVPANETFEGLTQGLVDCTLSPAVDLVDLSLMDAVKYIVVEVPGGGFGGTAQSTVNSEVWKDLSKAEREIIMRASAAMSGSQSWRYRMLHNEYLDRAKAKGIEVVEISPDLLTMTQDFTRADIQGIGASYEAKFGIKNAGQKAETMQKIFDRWMGLVANVESAEQLEALMWDEVLSKVDLDSYGL